MKGKAVISLEHKKNQLKISRSSLQQLGLRDLSGLGPLIAKLTFLPYY